MNKQISIVKILTIDYAAFIGWLTPIVLWGMYVFLFVSGKEKTIDLFLLISFTAITILAIAFLFWRIIFFFTLFNYGIESVGTIKNVYFLRDRGRVEYEYSYQGQKLKSGNAIHKVKRTRAINIGDQVILMIDRNNPKRAFIRDLFLK